MSPGIVVPSSEQKQSGKLHTDGSHGGARFGSVSASAIKELAISESKTFDNFSSQIIKI